MSVNSMVPGSLTMPTLSSNPTAADLLNFEAQLMQFQTTFDAAKTGISTLGDAEAGAANTKPQAG